MTEEDNFEKANRFAEQHPSWAQKLLNLLAMHSGAEKSKLQSLFDALADSLAPSSLISASTLLIADFFTITAVYKDRIVVKLCEAMGGESFTLWLQHQAVPSFAQTVGENGIVDSSWSTTFSAVPKEIYEKIAEFVAKNMPQGSAAVPNLIPQQIYNLFGQFAPTPGGISFPSPEPVATGVNVPLPGHLFNVQGFLIALVVSLILKTVTALWARVVCGDKSALCRLPAEYLKAFASVGCVFAAKYLLAAAFVSTPFLISLLVPAACGVAAHVALDKLFSKKRGAEPEQGGINKRRCE